MWVALPLLCAAAGLLGLPGCGATDASASSLEKVHFKSWTVQHQKKYSSEEYHQRLQTFVGNWRKIHAHNAGNHTFKSTAGLPLLQALRGHVTELLVAADAWRPPGRDMEGRDGPKPP